MSSQGLDEMTFRIVRGCCLVFEKNLGLEMDNQFIAETFYHVQEVLSGINVEQEILSTRCGDETKCTLSDYLALGLYMNAIIRGGSNHESCEVIQSLKMTIRDSLTSFQQQKRE
jgi:hypothetical protein